MREKQPYRTQFAAILSNYTTSWVLVVSFDLQGIKINQYVCATLANAIIFVEKHSASKLKPGLPRLDKALASQVSVLAVGRHHFLLSVMKPAHSTRSRSTSPKKQAVESIHTWNEPKHHRDRQNLDRFVLKIAHDGSSLSHEIEILKKLSGVACPHIPELVWTRGRTELGIVPIGEAVLPGEP